MPIQIQCSAVIVRNDALERCLEGGAEEFGSLAETMSYSDGYLSQASFMSHVDAEQFAKGLELRGLRRSGDNPDFALVHERDQSVEPPCDWLILFEFERRLIATLAGNKSRKVIAPATEHDPDSIQHYSQEEVDKYLEFVERKGSIDTYRRKETGELVYCARHTETDNEIYDRVSEFVWKHHRQPGDRPVSDRLKPELQSAIEELQGLAARNPEAANVALTLGSAWFSLGNDDRARKSLERAHELSPDSYGILKELGSIVLAQQDFASAVSFGLKAVSLEPDNVELLGNLSVSQLLAGETEKASQTIQHAIKLDGSDSVNQNVAKIVADVLKGRRPQPRSLDEMMRPAKQKSAWQRIVGFFK